MAEMQKRTIDDLNRLHTDAKSADEEAVAEMRTAILLIAGEHYSKKMTDWWNRSRTTAQQSESAKLRITKNWMHRAHRLYMKSILSQAPGTTCSPRNPLELQDQKDAELCEAVRLYLWDKAKMKAKIREWVSDFTGPGECAAKIYFDPNKGYLRGYEAKVDELGQPMIDPATGQQDRKSTRLNSSH